jgi:glycosyltransferase involved in cell wall biosynthesis
MVNLGVLSGKHLSSQRFLFGRRGKVQMNFASAPATFVIPHWTPDFRLTQRHLEATLKGIFQQTDTNWRIVLVDDASPDPEAITYLQQLDHQYPDQIHILYKKVNEGAGVARNLGIQWVQQQNSPLILFNDADDLSYPRRLEVVRRVFVERPTTGVVYSTFRVIDQDGQELSLAEMTGSVAEVIEAHRQDPPQGDNAWIAIGTETGYINHTSSTAVRTDLAVQFPFPPERVSEDSHAWFRYSAGGGPFVYVDEPLSAYRNTRDKAGSKSRLREGGKRGFYATKARVDAEGFRAAVQLALANKKIRPEQTDELLVKFYLRLGLTLAREEEVELASEQFRAALTVSPELTAQWVGKKGLADQPWAQAGQGTP